MVELIIAVFYGLALSIPISIALGFLYYLICVGAMIVLRRIFGDGHRGYYLLSLMFLGVALTFLMAFSFFVRRF